MSSPAYAPQADPRPFISIVAWPENASREDVAQLLAETTGIDAATLHLRFGKEPPMVLEQIEPDAARRTVELLYAHGGDGFTFTFADLLSMGTTLRVRDLRVVAGGIDVEIRDGMTTTLARENIQILVRAQIARTVTRRVEPRFGSLTNRMRTRRAVRAAIEGAVERDLETTELLDIHTSDGSIFQIDGDRFSYQALGALKGFTDKVNMDHMCELLSHLAPDEVVDMFFSLWRPPVGHHRLTQCGPRVAGAKRENPDFAFYSRWSALVYRHVLGVR